MKQFVPKLFDVMKSYTVGQFAKDVVSGIIVAIIALPLSIALALASGVGPEQGIYTAIFAGFVMETEGLKKKILEARSVKTEKMLACCDEVYEIAEKTGADVVQVVGSRFVLFKRNPKDPVIDIKL